MPEPVARSTDPRALDQLAERGKAPNSKSVLDNWVNRAQATTGIEVGRLSHLIASTVAVAVLQQAVDESGLPLFLLKGGTYLQYRLPSGSRATKDVDGLVRGDLETFLEALDEVLALDWGVISLQRTAAETIAVPGKILKPRRFQLKLAIRGVVWRSIKVEISPDEAGAGDLSEMLRPVQLKHFGIPTPDQLFGIAVQYQIAQKFHACTDPHDPPQYRNERARDLPDLLLLKDLTETEGAPSLNELRAACEAVFAARATEAAELGRDARTWPPQVTAYAGWESDYQAAASEAGIGHSLDDAVDELNGWIFVIANVG